MFDPDAFLIDRVAQPVADRLLVEWNWTCFDIAVALMIASGGFIAAYALGGVVRDVLAGILAGIAPFEILGAVGYAVLLRAGVRNVRHLGDLVIRHRVMTPFRVTMRTTRLVGLVVLATLVPMKILTICFRPFTVTTVQDLLFLGFLLSVWTSMFFLACSPWPPKPKPAKARPTHLHIVPSLG